jgi:hypothetical protein
MNIVHIETLDNGDLIATVADDEGNIVGTNLFTSESDPQPEVGPWPKPGFWSRAWEAVFG